MKKVGDIKIEMKYVTLDSPYGFRRKMNLEIQF